MKIPYKIYLNEEEMPKQYYNMRADMKKKPAPLLNPGTLQPMTAAELEQVFCKELVQQELDDTTPYIDIPEEILSFYKMYRPSPLVRAYELEKKLGTPAHIRRILRGILRRPQRMGHVHALLRGHSCGTRHVVGFDTPPSARQSATLGDGDTPIPHPTCQGRTDAHMGEA